MKKMALHTTLQLSMKEYIDTLSGLVVEYYGRAAEDKKLMQELHMSQEEQSRFTVEYLTVLLVIEALSWNAKPKLTSEKYRTQIQEAVARDVYGKLVGTADGTSVEECMKFYQARLGMFGQICKQIWQSDPEVRQKDIVGFARYLLSRVSERSEKEGIQALKYLGIQLSSATDSFYALITNTVQDSYLFNRKPSYIVQK